MGEIFRTEEGRAAVHARYRQLLAYWPVANEQLRLPTREGETFVIACGPAGAPALVLLHGAQANALTWMGDVSAWSQHFRVYAIDVIGDVGLSAPSRPKLDTDGHALWLDDVLAGLGVERAAFVGLSLGGFIALDYAIRRPERVTALALLCPAGVGRQKNLLARAFPLPLLGSWGQRKLREMVFGPAPENPSPAAQAFGGFFAHDPPACRAAQGADSHGQRRGFGAPRHTGDGGGRRQGRADRFRRNPAPARTPYSRSGSSFPAGRLSSAAQPDGEGIGVPAPCGAMTDRAYNIGEIRVLECSADGPTLLRAGDVSDYISAAWEHQAALVAIPFERLAEDFFRLRTRLAGEAIQKFVNYRVRVAIVGDVSVFIQDSDALRDFINESNHGQHIWFVSDLAELHDRLAG